MVHFTWSKPRHPKHAQIQTIDLSTAFCSRGCWSLTPNLCPVQKKKKTRHTTFLVCPYFSMRCYCLIRPPFLFTFRVALPIWNALQPDEAVFLLQVEGCITYRMLILRPYQLRTGSSSVFYRPRTQMADCNGYSGRKKNTPWKSCKIHLKWKWSCFLRQNGTGNSKCDPKRETKL